MTKKEEKDEADKVEAAQQKAEKVAKAIDAQAKADVHKLEQDAIKAGKETELLAEQVWSEPMHENPFEASLHAEIAEVMDSSNGKLFVKFVAVNPNRADVKSKFEYLVEAEFRSRFPKFVK